MAVKKNAAPAAEKPATKVAKSVEKAVAKAPAKKAVAKEQPKAVETKAEVVRLSRKELAASVREIVNATDMAVSLKVAEAMVVAYEEAIASALAAGSEINLPGFGKFVSIHREEAEKRNPATGEMVTVAAHNVPKFKVGSKLKAAVNGGAEIADED